MKDLQKVLGRVRRAVEKYGMLHLGDRVAVGVSGGKDSMLLLKALAALSDFEDYDFSVLAVTLDPSFENAGGLPLDTGLIKSYAESLGIESLVIKSDVALAAVNKCKDSSPCSICAHLRRGAVTDAAEKAGCNVLALGHHMDDVAETYIMNIFNCGRAGCFSPVTDYPDRSLRIIRPLIYLREHEISSFVRASSIPVCTPSCPFDGVTDREHFKDLLKGEDRRIKGVHKRIVGALERSGADGWKK